MAGCVERLVPAVFRPDLAAVHTIANAGVPITPTAGDLPYRLRSSKPVVRGRLPFA
jgi:hypothetical protein